MDQDAWSNISGPTVKRAHPELGRSCVGDTVDSDLEENRSNAVWRIHVVRNAQSASAAVENSVAYRGVLEVVTGSQVPGSEVARVI